MYAIKQKLNQAAFRAIPIYGQVMAFLDIPNRMEDARNEDAFYRKLMWQLGEGEPLHLGDSEIQERFLLTGEFIGNISMALAGLAVGTVYVDVLTGFLAAYFFAAIGDFVGCQTAYAIFNHRPKREVLIPDMKNGEEVGQISSEGAPPDEPST